jgi:hypothetical protein
MLVGGRGELMSSAVDDEIVTARCRWNDKDLVVDIEDMPCVFVWRWRVGSSCGCHGRILLELVVDRPRPQELLLRIEEGGAKDSTTTTTTRQQESGCRHNSNSRWNRINNNNARW